MVIESTAPTPFIIIYLFEGAFPQTQTNHVMMSTKELTGCTLSDSDKNIM
jgi:hypothetical protein